MEVVNFDSWKTVSMIIDPILHFHKTSKKDLIVTEFELPSFHLYTDGKFLYKIALDVRCDIDEDGSSIVIGPIFHFHKISKINLLVTEFELSSVQSFYLYTNREFLYEITLEIYCDIDENESISSENECDDVFDDNTKSSIKHHSKTIVVTEFDAEAKRLDDARKAAKCHSKSIAKLITKRRSATRDAKQNRC